MTWLCTTFSYIQTKSTGYLDNIAMGVTARDLVIIATDNPGASLSNRG